MDRAILNALTSTVASLGTGLHLLPPSIIGILYTLYTPLPRVGPPLTMGDNRSSLSRASPESRTLGPF